MINPGREGCVTRRRWPQVSRGRPALPAGRQGDLPGTELSLLTCGALAGEAELASGES